MLHDPNDREVGNGNDYIERKKVCVGRKEEGG